MRTQIKISKSLGWQVVIAIVAAVIFGLVSPEYAQKVKFLGDVFIRLIKMCITPIIFCTIALGIASSNASRVGHIGLKSFIYFEVLTTLAMIIGVGAAYLFKPGVGMNASIDEVMQNDMSAFVAKKSNLYDFLINIIPDTILHSFTNGDILSILFVAVIFGFALLSLKEKVPLAFDAIEELSKIMFKIVSFVVKFAPFGAFGAMSYTVGKYGLTCLIPMIKMVLYFYLTCAFFIFIVLGVVMKFCKASLTKLLIHIKEELILVFGTSSSESALPSLMKKMEEFGCKKAIVGLVIPAGYSLNLDGSCIYFTMAIIFIAQAFNIDLSMIQLLTAFGILLVASKGAAGVSGSAFIILATTISSFDIVPLAGLSLLLGIDRFMSAGRAITNLVGNSVATVVINKWESNK